MSDTITMNDGSNAIFTPKQNVISSYDVDKMNITFKVRTGEVISWDVEETENLNGFQKKVFLFGLFRRIKSSLTSLKDVQEIAKTIQNQIDTLKKGVFNIRSSESGVELDTLVKAFGIVMSGKFPGIPANPKTEWTNIDDPEVCQAVLASWNALSRQDKTKIRKNPYVAAVKAELDKEEAEILDINL